MGRQCPLCWHRLFISDLRYQEDQPGSYSNWSYLKDSPRLLFKVGICSRPSSYSNHDSILRRIPCVWSVYDSISKYYEYPNPSFVTNPSFLRINIQSMLKSLCWNNCDVDDLCSFQMCIYWRQMLCCWHNWYTVVYIPLYFCAQFIMNKLYFIAILSYYEYNSNVAMVHITVTGIFA